ncbi:PREDICTED: afadin- and alpha-actinin-binding protein-like isoform X2 [Branchiostoma belcheri]|uniref:Afadin- and alpha-actinin-binding protein-like isoform X2 n=1 Tax=Branchiostoma belcheri TaxID=7741 RepID=A0A6P4XSQ7_BRABE|nr:PREDICTED: afadin- and alpha-actinin-binding protein-like isoform X2 [Branchiostoma belcheri]
MTTSSFRSVFEDITAHHANIGPESADEENNVSLQMWQLLGANSPAHSGKTPLPEKYLVHRDHLRPCARLGSENVFMEPSPMVNRASNREKLCSSCMADATFQLMEELPLFSLSDGFCTPDNIQDSLVQLDQELCLLGYPSIHNKSRAKSGRSFNLVQLVNVTYDLIAGHHKHLNKQRELEDQSHKYSAEIRHLENTQQHLKDQITSSEQDQAIRQERHRQLQSDLVDQEKKTKKLQDEVRKLKSVLQSRDTQFRHDLRKKEREMARVKDRLHALAEKKKERRQGIEILNVVPRGDGGRKTWKTSKEEKKSQEELHRSIVANYEEREKELRTENQELRETLTFLQQEVSTVFSAVVRQDREHNPMSPDSLDHDDLGDGHLQMPYEVVQNIVEGKLKDQLHSMLHLIGGQTSHQGSNERNCASDEAKLNDLNAGQRAAKAAADVESRSSNGEDEESDDGCSSASLDVEARLEAYKTLIMKQEELLQQTFAAADCEQDTQDALFIEEKMALERERREMEEEKATFAEERKRFTDAAIRLGRDRQKFEEERTHFLKYQYLNITPPKATTMSSHSHSVSMVTASGQSMMSSHPGTPSRHTVTSSVSGATSSYPMTSSVPVVMSSHPMTSSVSALTSSHPMTSSVPAVTSSHPMTPSRSVTSGFDKSVVSSPSHTRAACSRVHVPAVTSASMLAVSSVAAGRLSVSPGTAEFYRVLDQFPSPTRGNVSSSANYSSCTVTPAKAAAAQSVPPTPSTGDLYRVLDQLPSPLHNRLSFEQHAGGPSWLYKNQSPPAPAMAPPQGRHSMLCKVQTPQPVALRGTLFDPRRRRTWASPQCFRGVQASLFQ